MILKQQHTFFYHCPSFHTPRQTLLNNIRNINKQILSHGEDQLILTFLYGNHNSNLTVIKTQQLTHIKRNNLISNVNRTIQVPSFQLIIKKKF